MRIFYFLITILYSLNSHSESCHKVIEKIHLNKTLAPSLKDIIASLGEPVKTFKDRQIQYSWKDFTVLMEGRQIVSQHGKIDINNNEKPKIYHNINQYIEKLGAPKRISIKHIKKLKWNCSNKSFLEITSVDGVIQKYSGKLCRKSSEPVCSSFTRKLTPLTHD